MENEIDLWFTSWVRIRNVLIGGVYFYFFIIILVRFLGKRMTSQLNNFDWIINVAIGSLVASGILVKEISIIDASVAILGLAACQWLVTWAVIRFPPLEKMVKARPRLLTHKGEFLEEPMTKERISKSEVRAKLREQGFASLENANWVILESDGNMTVIPNKELNWSDAPIMDNVQAPSDLA